METIKNFFNYADKRVKIGLVVIGVVFAVAIVAFIVSLIPEQEFDSRVTVENFGEVEKLPSGYKRYIQDYIGNILKTNGIVNEAETANAVIREDSYGEEEDGSVRRANFIVDIEELRQSFAVTVVWSVNTKVDQKEIEDPNVIIKCPYYTDVIYTDTKCVASTAEEQLKRYLPYYDYASGVKYAVSWQKYVDDAYVRIEIPACNNGALLDEAKDSVKKWMKLIYLDPNDYRIETMNTCRE